MDTFVGAAAPVFDMVVDPHPDVLVVSLAGELDLACADALAELVAVELAGLDRDVVFDLAPLDFIDIVGARLLGVAGRLVTRSGWRCTVVSPSPLAARVIEFAGFDDLLAGRCRREMVHGRRPYRALGEEWRHSVAAKSPAEVTGLDAVGAATAGRTPGEAGPGMGPAGDLEVGKERHHGQCSGNTL